MASAPSTASLDDEVLARVLAIARADPRVRAVILAGSRADPAAPADAWQDHDVTFVVRDVAPFRADPTWIDVFGERAILQRPDAMFGAPPRDDGGEAYLMLFVDGSRIDLTLLPVEAMASFRHDGPAEVLFDLDGVVPSPPPHDEPAFVPAPPTVAAFADVCNEFWWVAPYVAKGLARGETTYAHHHLDTVLRAQLLTMLGWEVAAASGFRRGPGKFGRFLRRELPPSTWARLEATYAGAEPEYVWAALAAMAGLFREVAVGVAERFGFAYPWRDDDRVMAHIERVRAAALPPPPRTAEGTGRLARAVPGGVGEPPGRPRAAPRAQRNPAHGEGDGMDPKHRATFERTAEGGLIRFDRQYAYPIEEVWAAITQPQRLADWWAPFAADITVDLREGGSIAFDWPEHDIPAFEFRIVRLRPLTLLEHTHTAPGSWMLWELEPSANGTRLRATYFVPDPDLAIARGDVVGAHYGLDRLGALLSGQPVPVDMDAFAALQADYAEHGLAVAPPP